MGKRKDSLPIGEKEYRRKLYEENKDSYKKIRADFLYGISANFRQIRKDNKQEIEELEDETGKALEEIDTYEYRDKK